MAEKIKLPEWRPEYGPADRHPTADVIAIGAHAIPEKHKGRGDEYIDF